MKKLLLIALLVFPACGLPEFEVIEITIDADPRPTLEALATSDRYYPTSKSGYLTNK